MHEGPCGTESKMNLGWEVARPLKPKNEGKIAKMLLDEANDFSCATTDVLAFKMLYLTSFF